MNYETPVDETDRAQDIAPAQPPNRSPLVATGGRPMSIIPHSFEEAFRIGKAAVVGKWVPYGWSAEMATLAIMHGAEVGLPPMMSLQKIAVINGRPSLWGDAVPAIALATHQLEDWSETVTGEGDAMVATCMVKRRFIKSPMTVTFSAEDAKRAGLWQTEAFIRKQVWENKQRVWKDNQPNDSPWYRHPKRMLQMRARRAFRDLFADAFSGLYLAEELIGETEMRDVTPLPVEDKVDNPLGGDDETYVEDIAANERADLVNAPEKPADAPKPKRVAKPRAAPKDAPAATVSERLAPSFDEAVARAQVLAHAKDAEKVSFEEASHPNTVAYPAKEDFIRWTGPDYVAYLVQWCNLAAVFDGEGFLRETYIRDRHKQEMAIRNSMGTPLTAVERELMNDICRGACKGIEQEAPDGTEG